MDRTEKVSPGRAVDYGTHGRIVGIEMLHPSTPAQDLDIHKRVFEIV